MVGLHVNPPPLPENSPKHIHATLMDRQTNKGQVKGHKAKRQAER